MSVNKVILIGNLGSDVYIRHLPDGRPVGNVSIATTEHLRDRDGEKRKHTEWHRISFFGKFAELAEKYLRKGSKIYVEGKLRTRKWVDKDDIERQTTEITVSQMTMLDRRDDRERSDDWNRDSESGNYNQSSDSAAGKDWGERKKSSAAQSSNTADQVDHGGSGLDDMDEDIPW